MLRFPRLLFDILTSSFLGSIGEALGSFFHLSSFTSAYFFCHLALEPVYYVLNILPDNIEMDCKGDTHLNIHRTALLD